MPKLHEMLEGPKHMPHIRQIQVGWLGATGAFYPWPTEPTREQEPGSYIPVYIDEEEGPKFTPVPIDKGTRTAPMSPDEHAAEASTLLDAANDDLLDPAETQALAQMAMAHYLGALVATRGEPVVAELDTTVTRIEPEPSAIHAKRIHELEAERDTFHQALAKAGQRTAALRHMIEEPCCPTGEETARRALDGTFPPTAVTDVLRSDDPLVPSTGEDQNLSMGELLCTCGARLDEHGRHGACDGFEPLPDEGSETGMCDVFGIHCDCGGPHDEGGKTDG